MSDKDLIAKRHAAREDFLKKLAPSAIDFIHEAEKSSFSISTGDIDLSDVHNIARRIGVDSIAIKGEVSPDSAMVTLTVTF